MKKRLISLILCVCMLISCLAVMSSCEIEDDRREREEEDTRGTRQESETDKKPRPSVEYKKNESFEEAQMYFALNLFKESVYSVYAMFA